VPLALALLDLDHFKQINDTYGHGVGDDALAAFGTTVRAVLRASDFVGRHGGEEFVVLLPETERAQALTVAEKVRSAVATITIPDVDRPITVSIGVAVFPDDATEAATLLRQADRALYLAKANGRNRIENDPTGRGRRRPPSPEPARDRREPGRLEAVRDRRQPRHDRRKRRLRNRRLQQRLIPMEPWRRSRPPPGT